MWASRIRTGFHRIGIVLAGISLILGALAFFVGAYNWLGPIVKPPIYELTSKDGSRLKIRYGMEPKEIGAAVKVVRNERAEQLELVGLIDELIGRIDAQREDGLNWMFGSLLGLLAAALLYAICWTIGWCLAGFMGG